MAGVPGAYGRPGAVGPPGPAGPTGAQGPVGIVDRWTSFRDIWFDFDRADVQSSEMGKVSEIADYMKQNPSIHAGIDGNDPRNQQLSRRRADAVRHALIQAGVPAHRIHVGALGDPQVTRDRRVEVLLKTGN